MMVIPVLLMTGCATKGGLGTETEETICRELRRKLPSFSSRDTEQTKEEGDRFLTVFEAVCPS